MECSGETVSSCPSEGSVTYEADIKQILDAKCTDGCHTPGGEESGTRIDSYSTAKVRAQTIRRQVEGCAMPPSDEPLLSDEERRLLLTWIACGAPEK